MKLVIERAVLLKALSPIQSVVERRVRCVTMNEVLGIVKYKEGA
jgi:DNA polymerase III sliding clamp (beta) subunit (PCNA family)